MFFFFFTFFFFSHFIFRERGLHSEHGGEFLVVRIRVNTKYVLYVFTYLHTHVCILWSVRGLTLAVDLRRDILPAQFNC